MSTTLLIVQILNGLQLGVLLFLIAAGLTLVFGVMDFINLAHGVQYMLGAYLAVHRSTALTGSFLLGARCWRCRPRSPSGCCWSSLVFRHLYDRDHLDQVLATFGIILFLNQGVKIVWGAAPLQRADPGAAVRLGRADADGLLYPVYRLAIIGAGPRGRRCCSMCSSTHTRIGMLVRAGATNAPMVSALGVDIRRLFMIVFGFGAMLAGFAGVMIAPILSVEPGMGDNILILAFVVIVIGGIGSIRGAFVAALLVGLVDTLGRSFAVDLLRLFMAPSPARTVGPALASMLIYLLMALVLFFRPAGLFPAQGTLTMARRRSRARRRRAAPRRARARRSLPVAAVRSCSRSCRSRPRSAPRRYMLGLFTRVMIFAIAALVARPVLVGYGALVSLRPRGLPRLGAYAVGILAAHGVDERADRRCRPRSRPAALFALRDRRDLPAHHGRLLHHDHAGLRADGVLHRRPRSRPMAATTA